MRLLTYEDSGVGRVGIYVGEKMGDLSRVAAALGHQPLTVESMRDLIRHWDRVGSSLHKLEAEAERRREQLSSILMVPEDVIFLPPVPDPPKNVMCIVLNYRDHAAEGIRKGAVPKSMAENPHPISFT